MHCTTSFPRSPKRANSGSGKTHFPYKVLQLVYTEHLTYIITLYFVLCTLYFILCSAGSEEEALEKAANKFNVSKDKISLQQGASPLLSDSVHVYTWKCVFSILAVAVYIQHKRIHN